MNDTDIFNEYLMQDEKILWYGKEKYRMSFDLRIFIGIAMIVIAIYNLFAFNQSKFSTVLLFLFILFMLYMIFDIPNRSKIGLGIYCAVTDVRVIQYNKREKKFYSCMLKDTDNIITEVYKKGYGSVCFSSNPEEDAKEYDLKEKVILFDYIDNPKHAADIARKARKQLLNSNDNL